MTLIGIATAVKDIDIGMLISPLESFVGQDAAVTLVDYGSAAARSEKIRAVCERVGVDYVGVRVSVENPKALWSASVAYNIGIRRNPGEVVASICPDVFLCTNFAPMLLEEYDKPGGAWTIYTCRQREIPRGYVSLNDTRYPLSNWDQSVIAMHRDRWSDLRGFDERWPGGLLIDNDLVQRAVALGMRKVRIGADILHQWHPHSSHHGDEAGPHRPLNPEDWGTLNRTVDQGGYGKTRVEEAPCP